MATNPMRRQAKNSFLLGMVITLLIAAVIVGFLFMKIQNLNNQIKEEQGETKFVYVLNQDIKSGQVITSNMFIQQEVKSNVVPADATSNINTLLNNYSLCDKAGNNIYTDSDGSLYMSAAGNSKTPVYKEDATGSLYTQSTNGAKTYIETTRKSISCKS